MIRQWFKESKRSKNDLNEPMNTKLPQVQNRQTMCEKVKSKEFVRKLWETIRELRGNNYLGGSEVPGGQPLLVTFGCEKLVSEGQVGTNRAQERPSWAQDGPRWVKMEPSWSQIGSSWASVGAKLAPRWPPKMPKREEVEANLNPQEATGYENAGMLESYVFVWENQFFGGP